MSRSVTFDLNGTLRVLRDAIDIRIERSGEDHRVVVFASKRFLIAWSETAR
jgi:hypothetical protein